MRLSEGVRVVNIAPVQAGGSDIEPTDIEIDPEEAAQASAEITDEAE